MLGHRGDDAGVDVGRGARLLNNTALDEQLHHSRVVEDRGAVANGLGVQDLHRLADLRRRPASAPSGEDAADWFRGSRMAWARWMKRVFGFEVLVCPRCASPMQSIALVTQGQKIESMLASIGYAADSPPLGFAA